MANLVIAPKGQSTPVVVFFDDSLQPVTYQQLQQTAKHGTLSENEPPFFENLSLEPGEVALIGYWLGTNAQSIADQFLTDFVQDGSVDRVELKGADDQGNAVSTRWDGTYGLTNVAQIEQPTQQTDNLLKYTVKLAEADDGA